MFGRLALTVGNFKTWRIGLTYGLTVFVLVGCGVMYRQADAWEGQNIEQLIESWGEADSELDLGREFRAYTWLSEDDDCEHTFTTQDDKIVGVSDTGCSG